MVAKIHSFTPTTDYCDPKLCQYWTGTAIAFYKHTACNNPLTQENVFGPDCVQPTIVPMTPELITMILKALNQCRADLANGKIAGFSSASNMIEMVNYFPA